MQVAERIERPVVQPVREAMTTPALQAAAQQASAQQDAPVVLKPLARPELGEIHLDGAVLAVGRHEAPFASFPREILVMLSRRHARIFRENGAVHVADLDSRNGTTLNRMPVQGQPCALKDGDELGFGGVLVYRVQIDTQARLPRPAPLSLTLAPNAPGSGLPQIAIAQFPFLVSKKDTRFAQGRAADVQQHDYLSRRHAHIFQKGGAAYVEDLGSTNGTFVDGQRLDERAVPLRDGTLLAFGGDHYVYRVAVHGSADDAAPATRTLAREATGSMVSAAPGAAAGVPAATASTPPAAMPKSNPPQAVPAIGPMAAAPMAPELNPGKTTFVAAPDSFLEIFCVDTHDGEGDEAGDAAASPAAPGTPQPAPKAARRSRVAGFFAELASVWSHGGHDRLRTSAWRGATVLAAVGGVIVTLALWTSTQGELKALLDRGEVTQAARLADEALRRTPDDAEIRALATDAALKLHVSAWLARIAERDFQG
ncbi:MAG: FHA domain-containing protein, partial [Rhizobacter sp.]|nr:FHA domain-containing protein [Rhizobacter sp.]